LIYLLIVAVKLETTEPEKTTQVIEEESAITAGHGLFYLIYYFFLSNANQTSAGTSYRLV
jgi:hypothetical protein